MLQGFNFEKNKKILRGAMKSLLSHRNLKSDLQHCYISLQIRLPTSPQRPLPSNCLAY